MVFVQEIGGQARRSSQLEHALTIFRRSGPAALRNDLYAVNPHTAAVFDKDYTFEKVLEPLAHTSPR